MAKPKRNVFGFKPPLKPERDAPFHEKRQERALMQEGTLGDLVVTDPRDPFHWLNAESPNPDIKPSSNGKQLLWWMYRMSGHPPRPDQDMKLRDERDDIEDVITNLTERDYIFFERYKAHLERLDAEAVDEIHDQQDAIALTAIVRHIKYIRREDERIDRYGD